MRILKMAVGVHENNYWLRKKDASLSSRSLLRHSSAHIPVSDSYAAEESRSFLNSFRSQSPGKLSKNG